MIAPLDSAQVRILRSMEMTDQRIEPGNALVRVSCYSQGTETAEVTVSWRSLSIRATKLEPFVNGVKVPD